MGGVAVGSMALICVMSVLNGFEATAGQIYAGFLAVVYFAPLLGGMLADRIGYGKCVTIGLAVMFLGYLGLAIPVGAGVPGMVAMFAGLACVSLGTGLFKTLQRLLCKKYLG